MEDREPSAELRQMASMLRQTHVALVKEGFTEDQAMKIISQIIIANMGK